MRHSTSGTAAAIGLFVLLAWAPRAAAAFTLHDLMARLASSGAVEARYTEVRDSPLLAEPVELHGRIRVDPAGEFVKTTEGEEAATIHLQGEEVVMERGGETRTVSLSRHPAMALLVDGLFALVRGDADALQARFRTRLEGDAGDWRLTLEPRVEIDPDRPGATQTTGLVRLTVAGENGHFRRMVLEQSAGQRTVMTFRPVDER